MSIFFTDKTLKILKVKNKFLFIYHQLQFIFYIKISKIFFFKDK